MSILQAKFEEVAGQLHYGPALEPFFRAVIEEHDKLQARVDELEVKHDAMFPKFTGEPTYIIAPQEAAAQAIIGHVPDDAASLIESAPAAPEPDPAEPAQTPVSDLLVEAPPEPVPAGPDENAAPSAEHADEHQEPAAPEVAAQPDPAA